MKGKNIKSQDFGILYVSSDTNVNYNLICREMGGAMNIKGYCKDVIINHFVMGEI